VSASDDSSSEGLPGNNVTNLTTNELLAAIQHSEDLRKAGRARTGRLLAELHRRGQLSWPAIARATGIRQTTAYELALPFLGPDPDEGLSEPRQSALHGSARRGPVRKIVCER
jgi:hypothetical protein